MASNQSKGFRVPPQSLEAEQALIGSIFLRPEVMHDIIDTISSQSFYNTKHRLVFETIIELFAKSEPVDLLTVSSRLKEKKKFEETGGMTYLSELAQSVPSSAHAPHYAQLVQKKYIMRQLLEASEHISHLGHNEEEDIDALLDKAEKRIFDVTNTPSTKRLTALKETLGDAWERLDALHKAGGTFRGVPSGFVQLDNLLSGFQKSDLVIIAARPSVGKTALALDIARNAAIDHKVPVALFSLEMSSQQLVDRLIAADAKVNSWHLRTGRIKNDDEFDAIKHSLGRLAEAPIFIDDEPGNNILKMRAVARRLKSQHGLGLIIVDYLQLMHLPGSRPSDSMVQQVTEISRSLKNLARELEVPVIALSQLSRAVEQRGGRPRLSDLRDSGSIEQDADVVAFIHRENKDSQDQEQKNITEILIEKHRNGPTGRVRLYFKDSWSSFQNLDQDHLEMIEQGDEMDF